MNPSLQPLPALARERIRPTAEKNEKEPIMSKRGPSFAILCLFLTTSCALIPGTEPAGPRIEKGIPSSAYLFVRYLLKG